MCIAVPGRVIAVGPEGARVEAGGRVRMASTLLLPDVVVGEYVLVSAGTLIDRLSTEEAEARLALFAEFLGAEGEDEDEDAVVDDAVTEDDTLASA